MTSVHNVYDICRYRFAVNGRADLGQVWRGVKVDQDLAGRGPGSGLGRGKTLGTVRAADLGDEYLEKSEIERRPASENPWYVLMTIAGEQGDRFDRELHARNRRFWHGWLAKHFSHDVMMGFVNEGYITVADIDPLNGPETTAWSDAVKSRNSKIPSKLGSIKLNSLVFDNYFSMAGFFIPKNFYIQDCVFGGFLELQDTMVDGYLSIRGCRVDRVFSMERSCISGVGNFTGTEFSGHVEVKNSQFLMDVAFDDSIFCGPTNFDGTTFKGEAHFKSVRFLDYVGFNNCDFGNSTSFDSATFGESVPTFYNAKLHEDTEWNGIVWPLTSNSPSKARWQRRAYERLKLLMDNLRKSHDEQMFHRMELRCREVEDGFPRNVPSQLYGMLAEYGWSFARPGIALGLVVMLGWLVLGPVLCWGGGTAAEVSACSFRGLYVSVSNTFGFLGLWRLIPDAVDLALQASVLAMIVKVVQAVLGPVFLFFVLLALRNRYRMR